MIIEAYSYHPKLAIAQASFNGRINCGISIWWNTTWRWKETTCSHTGSETQYQQRGKTQEHFSEWKKNQYESMYFMILFIGNSKTEELILSAKNQIRVCHWEREKALIGKACAGTFWVLVWFCILMRFGLHRHMHLSKLSKHTSRFVHSIVNVPQKKKRVSNIKLLLMIWRLNYVGEKFTDLQWFTLKYIKKTDWWVNG